MNKQRSASLLDLLARPFALLLLRLTLARPRTVLVACVVAAAVCLSLASTRIGFNADLNAVIGGEHRFNLVFEDYRASFGEHANLIVVIHDGHHPRSHTFAHELAQAYRDTGEYLSAMAVLPPPNATTFVHEPLEVLEDALFLLEPLRDVLARQPQLHEQRRALRARELRSAEQEWELAEIEALLALIPEGKELVRPLMFSDIADVLADQLEQGEPADVRRAAAYASLLEVAFADSRAGPFPERRESRWRVPDFYAWVRGNARADAAQAESPVALVVVTPHPESTHVANDQAAATPAQQRLSEAEALALFRRVFEEVRLTYPHVSAGLTGRPLLNAEEQVLQQRASVLAGSLSFTIVLLLVFVFVRRVRLSVAIGTALAVALAWTMGFIALAIGELNVLSAAFAVVLAAIGVDFGVHLATSYEHRERLGEPKEQAIRNGFSTIGRGVIAAAITTALGFLVTMVAEFQAIAELGQIAAVGMLLCLLSMFTVLPALIMLLEKPAGKPQAPSEATPESSEAQSHWRMPLATAITVLVLGALLVTAGLVAGQRVGFNTNRLELLDPTLPAISWMRVMDLKSPQSSRFGVAVAESEAEARELAEAFRARPELVRDVIWLGEMIPEQAEARRELLSAWAGPEPYQLRRERDTVFRPERALAQLRMPTPVRPGEAPTWQDDAAGPPLRIGVDGELVTAAEHARQQMLLAELLDRMETDLDASRLATALERLQRAIEHHPEHAESTLAPLAELVGRWQRALAEGLDGRDTVVSLTWQRSANFAGPGWERLLRGELATLEALATHLPTTYDELPQALGESYHHRAEDRWLIQAFAAQDIWEEEAGRAFVAFGESVHPDFTGPAAQYLRAVDLMESGLLKAAKLALLAVFVLLLFDFLPWRRALWPLAVLALALVGFVQVAGLAFADAVPWAVALAALLALPWVYPVALAATPLGAGIALTLGAMAAAGQTFNPANVVVLPALLGIGIDIGLHLVHAARQRDGCVRLVTAAGVDSWRRRLRSEVAPGEVLPRLLTPTARAILITSITTVAGFGTLIVAGHAGIRSLGWLFAVAIILCTVAAFTLLPAITRLRPLPRIKDE